MPDPDFVRLKDQLLRSGVSPRHVQRASSELELHYLDLRAEYIAAGYADLAAESAASAQLGSLPEIGKMLAAQPALRHWSYRYPLLGRVLLPVIYAFALPVAPLAATAACANVIARWGAIASLSAAVTAGMFLAIQMSITLG